MPASALPFARALARAGLSCRDGDEWRGEVLAETVLPEGELPLALSRGDGTSRKLLLRLRLAGGSVPVPAQSQRSSANTATMARAMPSLNTAPTARPIQVAAPTRAAEPRLCRS